MTPRGHAGEPVEIRLRRPYREFVLCALFFGACAAVLAHRALANDRGLILNGLIPLDPGGAAVFYAALALLSAALCAMGLVGIARTAALEEFRILLGDRAISFPATPLRGAREITVPLERIEAVETQPPARPAMLVIREDGRAHVLPRSWFTGRPSVQDAADMIITRVREAQPARRAGG